VNAALRGAALCGLLAAPGCGAPPVEPDPPNVVLLIIDTLRADKLHSYGFPLATSPEIDAMAAQGVLFEQVIAPCSWTRPSIGAMLTGRYPRSLGIYHESKGILPDEATTLAEVLDEAGYLTVGITANPHLNRSFNFDQGFDQYFDSDAVYTFMKKASEQRHYKSSRVATAPEMFEIVLDSLDYHPDQGPYYVQVDMMEVHEWYRGDRSLTRPPFDTAFEDVRDGLYLRPILQSSHDVQQFVDRLRARPGWEDTLFVITSDHGEGLSDHPDVANSRYHGRLLYESNLRVPLILYRPGWQPQRQRVAEPVRLLDLMPTLVEMVGLEVPEGLDGLSLLPLIEGGARPALPEFFVAETQLRDADKAAVYSARWKYIESYQPHEGHQDRELHAIGSRENGAANNRLIGEQAATRRLTALLESWNGDVPRVATTHARRPISSQEIEQLRALGYID
jgi:arylsulfatase A-like enzyme